MNSRPEPPAQPTSSDNEQDLNTRLKKRLLIAGGLVAVAIGAVAMLDGRKSVPEVAPASTSGKIVLPETSAPAALPAEPPATASAPAIEASAPEVAVPPSPDTSKTPGVAAANTRPLAVPSFQAAPSSGSTPAPATTPQHPSMQEHRAPQVTAPRPAPTEAPPATAPSRPQPAERPPFAARPQAPQPDLPQTSGAIPKARPAGTSLGYQVQLGLFSSLDNAQKLVSALRQQGVEVHTETRVHLGPFNSRVEADEAMQKLKSLGYNPLLVAPGQ